MPKGVLGKHRYPTGGGEAGTAAAERRVLQRDMDYFGMPSDG